MKYENDGYEPTPYDRILSGIHAPAREAEEVAAAESIDSAAETTANIPEHLGVEKAEEADPIEPVDAESLAGTGDAGSVEAEDVNAAELTDSADDMLPADDVPIEFLADEAINTSGYIKEEYIPENTGIELGESEAAEASGEVGLDSFVDTNRLSQIGDDRLVYTTLEFTEADDEKVVRVYVEEDILVPDIKPDMASILSMDGCVRCSDREIKTGLKAEDGISIGGDITLKTIYIPENKGTNSVVTIQSRVPFKADEPLRIPAFARMSFNPVIEKIEYSVVNERKFRAKLTIAVHAKEYLKKSMSFFEGIDGEEIQLLKEKVTFTDVMVKKSDAVDLKETIAIKDGMPEPEQVLKFDLRTVENHKQITQERAVINASVYYSVLYLGKTQAAEEKDAASEVLNAAEGALDAEAARTRETNAPYMCQGKLDFTQFISLNGVGGQSGSRVTFDDSDLIVKIKSVSEVDDSGDYERESFYDDSYGDDSDSRGSNSVSVYSGADSGSAGGSGASGAAGKAAFVLEGSIGTSIEVYKNIEGEAATDVYHNEKELIYDSEEFACSALEGSGVVEIPVREIVNVPAEYGDIDRVIYVSGKLIESEAQSEYGKEIVSGVLQAELLAIPEDKSLKPFKLEREIPFRGSMDILAARSGMMAESDMYIRELRCDKINDKQVEINAGVFVSGTVYSRSVQRLIKNPAFIESESDTSRKAGMILYITKPQEDLWSIAKKFRTTMAKIRSVNELAGEATDRSVPEGSRLLIIK